MKKVTSKVEELLAVLSNIPERYKWKVFYGKAEDMTIKELEEAKQTIVANKKKLIKKMIDLDAPNMILATHCQLFTDMIEGKQAYIKVLNKFIDKA